MSGACGPASRHFIALGDHILNNVAGVRESDTPLSDEPLDILQTACFRVGRTMVYIVGGENLVRYLQVSRVEEVFEGSANGCFVLLGHEHLLRDIYIIRTPRSTSANTPVNGASMRSAAFRAASSVAKIP